MPSFVSASNNVVVDVNNHANSYTTWHRRLGHAHEAAIPTVLQLCNVSCPSKTVIDFRNACCLGKSHRVHAPPSHTIQSTGGHFYYMSLVDADTHFTWIYFLKLKFDALTAFKQFIKLIETQFETKIKAIQTDESGEFKVFTKLLVDLGITHRFTCPYISHQNGTVERKHGQIVEMGLSLIAQASIPLNYWDHGFTTAVYLINRLPTTALSNNLSPF